MGRVIQIVEDDEDIRYILEYVLQDSGFILETFDCIGAFMNRSRKTDVQLIMLDVRLPDGSGFDLCKSLKKSDSLSNIPIIIMSAHANGHVAVNEAKADDFMAKPFDLDTLSSKVKTLLTNAAHAR
jgi:two-component system phosphate regulon response regulator PhoB